MGIKIVGNKNIESLLDFLRVKKFHIKHEAINKLRVSHHNPAFLKSICQIQNNSSYYLLKTKANHKQ
jgi:hypothetical protein